MARNTGASGSLFKSIVLVNKDKQISRGKTRRRSRTNTRFGKSRKKKDEEGEAYLCSKVLQGVTIQTWLVLFG